MVKRMDILTLCSCFIFLVFVRVSHSDNSCEELKNITLTEDTVNATVSDWFHLTLELNAENCTNQTFVISVDKMGTQENNNLGLICRFMLNGTSCKLPDNIPSHRCRCETWTGRAHFSTKLEERGRQVYRWRWFRKDSGKGGEKQININVAAAQKKSDQMLKYIMGAACGFLFLTFLLVLIFVRRLKPRSWIATSNRKAEPETLHNDDTHGLNSHAQDINDLRLWQTYPRDHFVDELPTAESAPACAENCRPEIRDGCSTLTENVYSRLSYCRQTPPENQRALTDAMEMTVNVLYEDQPLQRSAISFSVYRGLYK